MSKSHEPTVGQIISGIMVFIILGIPLGGIGIAMLIRAEGIERWSGLIFLAFSFGIGQSVWRKISGKE